VEALNRTLQHAQMLQELVEMAAKVVYPLEVTGGGMRAQEGTSELRIRNTETGRKYRITVEEMR